VTRQELLETLTRLFGQTGWPKPLHLLLGATLLERGGEVQAVARSIATTQRLLHDVRHAADPVQRVLGLALHEVDNPHRARAAQMLGQLLLGRCAELAFERIYKSEMQFEEFELRDLREGRTDTDYRLYNGQGRPVYRINIKFHGSPFRRAKELVGLEPEDCFALATYKIHSALQKQHDEGLPYFFAIVGVPNLTGQTVGQAIPSLLVETVALIDQSPRGRSKRDFEDAAVRHLVEGEYDVFRTTLDQIMNAQWYILSARRADKLLRTMLFDRVFALRVRNFARAFGRAELDMHFSLSKDLVPLRQYLATLREQGPQKITTLLERGEY
jgi:hypothetical protein